MNTTAARLRLTRDQRRQLIVITLGAIALFVGVRFLPIGTNLSHGDFRVQGGNVIEMCDPARPAFIPVVDVRSPVDVTLETSSPPALGKPMHVVMKMITMTGKPIGPRDLAISHTHLLHLMVIDPSLADYHHIHPTPGKEDGTWEFDVTPNRAGVYRVFADFVPIATGLGLYAHADFTVPGEPGAPVIPETSSVVVDGFRYDFSLDTGTIRAGGTAELKLVITNTTAGATVPLEPVMGAFAHVVAFDPQRLGFAHLHPLAADPLAPLDPVTPTLTFRVTIPKSGKYVVWAQVKMKGQDKFAPFGLDVAP